MRYLCAVIPSYYLGYMCKLITLQVTVHSDGYITLIVSRLKIMQMVHLVTVELTIVNIPPSLAAMAGS